MNRVFFGACLGGMAGASPGLAFLLFKPDALWRMPSIFVLIVGTAVTIGAIAGSTDSILHSLRRERKHHRRSSDRVPEKHTIDVAVEQADSEKHTPQTFVDEAAQYRAAQDTSEAPVAADQADRVSATAERVGKRRRHRSHRHGRKKRSLWQKLAQHSAHRHDDKKVGPWQKVAQLWKPPQGHARREWRHRWHKRKKILLSVGIGMMMVTTILVTVVVTLFVTKK